MGGNSPQSSDTTGWVHNNNNLLGEGKRIFSSREGTQSTFLCILMSTGQDDTEVGSLALDKSSGVLTITFPLNQLFHAATATDWKERSIVCFFPYFKRFRVLDIFNLVVLIAQRETEVEFNQTQVEVDKYFGKSIPIKILWDDFDTHPEFKKLTPSERTRIVKACQTHFLQQILLGDYGYARGNTTRD